MGTAAKMAAAQKDVLKASTLAEAEAIRTRLQEEEQEVADVFFTQEQTIANMQEMLRVQESGPTYIAPAAPEPQRPNYVLYGIIGIVILLFTGKVKL